MKKFKKYHLTFLLVGLFSFLVTGLKAESNPAKNLFIVLNNPANSGFFATFASVLGALEIYEKGAYSGLEVDFNSGIYLDASAGPNWWEYFFEPIRLGNKKAVSVVFTYSDVLALTDVGIHLPREQAYQLIKKYIHLKPVIQGEINDFVNTYFTNHLMIGVHHRGTDKYLETPLISYEKTFWVLNHIMTNFSKEQKSILRIYVATDDQFFLNYLSALFPAHVIYNNFVRSTDNTPLHYNSNIYHSNFQKGKEALIDCLLLSQCQILIRPDTSTLSIMSAKFNPYLMDVPLTAD